MSVTIQAFLPQYCLPHISAWEFLVKQVVILWPLANLPPGDRAWPWDFTSLANQKRVVDFSGCSAFLIVKTQWQLPASYMPDWILEV